MYTIAQIQRVLKADGELSNPAEIIRSFLYDSRRLRAVEDTLFIAISGARHNGHDFIEELYKKGVRNFLVEFVPHALAGKANFIVVKNTLKAFQQLAAQHRLKSQATTVAITGSNGKTIVKEWLSSLLSVHHKITKTPKSYNSQLGVPLSVMQLTPDAEYAIFEAGISKVGEMQRLEKILKPHWGVFTNIGSAHQEYFTSLEEKINEKLKLFKEASHLVFCADNALVSSSIAAFSFQRKMKLLSWSKAGNPADIQFELSKGEITFSWQKEDVSVAFPYQDEASIENVLHAIVTALGMGVSTEVIKKTVPELEPVSMRLEMKNGRWNTVVVNDAYNADLESLKIALEYFAHQMKGRDRVLVLSDIEQSGLEPKKLYEEVARALADFKLTHIYTIGEKIEQLAPLSKASVSHFLNVEQFLKHLTAAHFSDKAILLKGARNYKFEAIDRFLTEKSHETVLEVNLSRMVDNLNFFRSKLKEGVKTMVMVKAFGYGAGASEISSLLQFHKVDYLAVAYADEGVALRKAGISLPIMVLNTEISALDDMLDFKLEPEVYSFRILEALRERVQKRGENEAVAIHIKLETGMHRLGFEEADLPKLIRALKNTKALKVHSAFSHLAASDDPEERDFSHQQIELFNTLSQGLMAGLGYHFDRHILNSSGISHYPNGQFDMVRLGIGLYGISGDAEEAKFLKPVSSLKATVSQVKNLKTGESVGYGRSYIAKKDEQIATISLGYADGFRRSLGNGVGEVYINGKRYPIVGRVCMDMAMVNISGSAINEGDEVEVFGPNLSLYELAEKMQTIPYEVLTSISSRVKRVYLME